MTSENDYKDIKDKSFFFSNGHAQMRHAVNDTHTSNFNLLNLFIHTLIWGPSIHYFSSLPLLHGLNDNIVLY